MTKLVNFEGQQFGFPDDASDDDVLGFLKQHSAPPSWNEVLGAVPGALKRGAVKTVAGIQQAAADITGNENWAQQAQGVSKELNAEAQIETPRNMTIPQEGVFSGLVSAGEMIPQAALTAVGVAAGGLTGPAALASAIRVGTSVMGAQTGIRKYQDVRDAGFTPQRSALSATFEGLVEKYTEYLPMADFLKNRKLLGWLQRELGGELLATTLQDANAKLHDNPNMTLGDFARDLAVTAIATPVGAVVQGGALKLGSAAVGGILPQQEAGSGQIPAMPEAGGAAMPGMPIAGPEMAQGGLIAPSPVSTSLESIAALSPEKAPLSSPLFAAATTLPSVASLLEREVPATSAEVAPAAQQLAQQATLYGVVDEAAIKTGYVQLSESRADVESRLQEGQKIVEVQATPEQLGTWQEAVAGKVEGKVAPITAVRAAQPVVQSPPVTKAPTAQIVHSEQPTATNQNEWPLEEWTDNGKTFNNIYTKPEKRNGFVEMVETVMPDRAHRRLGFLHELYGKRERAAGAKRPDINKIKGISAEIDKISAELKQVFNLNKKQLREAAETYMQAVHEQRSKRGEATRLVAPTLQEVLGPQKAVSEGPTAEQVDNALYEPLAGYPSAEQVTPGQTYIDSRWVNAPYFKRMAGFLNAWMKVFAPKMRIAIVGLSEDGTSGATQYSNGVHYVWIADPTQLTETKQATAAFTLAHEFGHMLVNEFARLAQHKTALQAIRAEYDSLLAETPNLTVGEFVTKWRGPTSNILIQRFGAIFGVSQYESAQKLIEAVDNAVHRPGYMLSFDEYLAEQFARYVSTRQETAITPEIKSMWDDVLSKIKQFFEAIVRKLKPGVAFEKWVDSLRVQATEPTTGETPQMRTVRMREIDLSLTADGYNYTTTVLSRLPQKDVIKKATIIAEVSRPDVRAQERQIIMDVLHDSPDTLDRRVFEQEVLQRVVPLTLQTLRHTQWNMYGYDNIQWPDNTMQNPLSYRSETHIWQVPFDTGENGHFPEAENYWAHTRVVNLEGVRSINEVQSDIEQKSTTLTFGTILLDRINAALEAGKNVITYQEYENWADEYSNLIFFPVITKDMPILAAKQIAVEDLQLRRAEALKNLAKADSNKALPQRWYELVLRHENVEAANAGQTQARVPDADTLIKLENWAQAKVYTAPDIIRRSLSWARILSETPAGVIYVIGDNYSAEIGRSLNRALTAQEREAIAAAGANEEFTLESARAQGTLNKYRREIIPFVNKEFGAKHVVDEFGQGWWQWDVNPALANKAIKYYQVDLANSLAADELAKNLPESGEPFSAAFKATQGFLNNTLQLNQMAKLLPEVRGLQSYRRLMQAMHNVKNALMEQPNQRLDEWHRTEIRQAELVEDALRAEEREGAHWTQLRQDTAVDALGNQKLVWVHQPNEAFWVKTKAAGINEVGAKLYLGIKNDFLRTLSEMEDTVTMAVNRDFKDAPLLLNAKLKQVAAEFQKLRETPYIPHTRFGNYSVQVRAGFEETVDGRKIEKGELVYWRKFTSAKERDAEYKILAEKYGKDHQVSRFYEPDSVGAISAMPTSLVDSLVAVLNLHPETALTNEQMQILKETKYDFSATGKFEKYLRVGRKGVGGAHQDLRQTYANYMWKTANAISKLRYGPQLRSAISEVHREGVDSQTTGESSDGDAYGKLEEFMQRNYEHVMHPKNEFQRLRAFVAMWYLMAVPKTALMNLSSLPVLALPYLGSRFGDAQATAAMLKAMKTAVAFMRNPDKLDALQRRLAEQARADGVIDQSFASMLAGVSEGGVAMERLLGRIPMFKNRAAGDTARKMTWRVMNLGMLPFRAIEQFNRLTTLFAYYELAAKGEKEFNPALYDEARDAVDYTQNEYSAWNAPRFMTGKLGSTMLIFYSFMQNMTFMMFGGDKGWWRAMLILGALAGLQGLPGAENLVDMLNWALRKMTGQNVDLWHEARVVADDIGMNPDLVLHGASRNLFGLGWDTSGSLGMGRVIPATDAIFGIGRFEQRFVRGVADVGGPFGSLAMSFLQALADDNPNTLARLDKVLPPAIRGLEKAWGATTQDAWVDGAGRPIVSDPTAVEVIGQAMGFSPTRRSEKQELLRVERSSAEFYTLRRQNLMAVAWDAKRSGDLTAWLDAKDAINEYNSEVPMKELKISSADLAASFKSRKKAERDALLGDSPTRRYEKLYAAVAPYYQ